MQVDVIQTSFGAGEIGPSLYGRTDIAQYSNACQIVQNFLIRPYGSAISAPGSRYVATVSDSTLRTRLIPFVFNKTDAYIIEMGDLYMRFFTNRGQVVNPGGTEDLGAFSANLKAHWKCNDNVGGTGTTLVLDAVTSHDGTASTITQSLSTTGIVNQAFNLAGLYHVSVADHGDFTRTAATQPMTVVGWAYYENNGATQSIFSKSGEYELSVNSSDELTFTVSSGASVEPVLLLHCDGVDASTTFTDSSASAKTVTAVGNAQIDTAQSKFGTASGLFDGTGDSLSVPSSADFDFGTGDFTVDFWVRFNDTAGGQGLFGRGATGTYIDVYKSAGGVLFYYIGGAEQLGSYAWSPSANTWYHLAFVRSGTSTMAFVNGVQVGSTGTNSSNISNSNAFTIGLQDAGLTLNGWIDEFRVVKGTAVWTSNFTPSGSAYTGGGSNSWKGNTDLVEGWNFLAVVFKGDGTSTGDCKIYINAVSQDLTFTSDPSFVAMSDTTSLFRLGANSSAGANNWKNKLDDWAFIHQELTAANILTLYSSSAYQITTVFTESEVFGVQFTQINDIIYLTHPNHPIQKLVRTTANQWAIADAPIVGGPFLDNNTPSLTSSGVTASTITLTASATTGTVNITVTPTNSSLFTLSSSTLGHHNSYWMIGGLSQTNATTGLQENGYVKITNVVNSYTATATVIKNLKTSAATTIWAEGAWSAVRGYPSRVSLHERRLWVARTNYEPQKIWGSRVFTYEDFALETQADDDGLNLPLASNESNEIQWLASVKSLVSGTFGGAFVINSRSTDPITPNNANAADEVGFGASSIVPKKIGSFLYFIQRFGMKLREMFYDFNTDTNKAVDRTILSPHILSDGVVDMAVQSNPDPSLYCVLTYGTLAIMVREADQDVTAWSRRTTSGTYTTVAVIPSQTADYDEVWYIAERYINGNLKKYVEYFETVEIPDRQDKCLYLDSALTYDAYQATSTSNCTISLSASSGSVTVTSSTAYFSGSNITNRIRAIDANGNTLGEGTITATASTTSLTLSITTTFNALSYAAGYWGISVRTVSGLSHLAAKTVGILADGLKDSLTRTIASDAVTLSTTAFVVNVGLSYDQILFTLPKEGGSNKGTSQGKLQRLSEIFFKLNRSTQEFQYGPDASNLDTANLVFTPTVTTLYTGVLPPQTGTIPMRGGYVRGACVYIKNSNPLPMEILNIGGKLETYEK